ncbi:MAG: hypothetical protein ACTIBK_02300 [Glutamicibacter arilaitensis]|uniref:hypothetical protein n=1 Tax=Glutamicibacter arilaitensis TaxID=256701 RepID=UPI003F92BD9E
MSNWTETKLGSLFTVDNSKLGPHAEELTVMSLSKYNGFVRADDYFDKRIASSKLDGYKVVQPGEWAFSTIHIDEGSIARNNLGETGVISPMYTTMRFVASDCMPEYAELLVRQPGMLAEYSRRAQGSINRRRSLPFKAFAEIAIALPTPYEQRRIVDAMAAVDAQIEALEEEAAAVRHLLRCMLSDHFELVTGDKRSVVGLCSHVIGGIWGSPEGTNETDVLALGPRIYTPATTGFVTDGSPLRSFSLKQVEQRLVQPNDIILERSGGSPEQPVGRVVIAEEGLAPCIPTDFQRLMRPDVEKVEPRYLFWRLQFDWNAGLTRAYSRRTTGITNLSVKDYIARDVAVPSRGEQKNLVATADTINASLTATKTELTHLRSLRSALLTSLLDQESEIPDTYDTFLEGAS